MKPGRRILQAFPGLHPTVILVVVFGSTSLSAHILFALLCELISYYRLIIMPIFYSMLARFCFNNGYNHCNASTGGALATHLRNS